MVKIWNQLNRGYVASAQSDLKEDDFLIFVDEMPIQAYVGASTKVDYNYVFGSHGYGLNKDDYFPDLDVEAEKKELKNEKINLSKKQGEKNELRAIEIRH